MSQYYADYLPAIRNIKYHLEFLINIHIKNFTKKLIKDYGSEDYATIIVSGGEALHQYITGEPQLETIDIDLKFVCGYKHEDQIPMTERMEKAKEFMYPLCAELNKYFSTNKEIFNLHGRKPIYQTDGNLFYVWHPSPTAPIYSIFYTLGYNNKTKRMPLVDIFIATANPPVPFVYWGFLANPILNRDHGPFYIPINKLFGINYASLGYLLWDTIMMINHQYATNGDKIQRYIDKFDAIIHALSHPEKHLSCFQLRGFLKTCSEKEKCDQNARIKRYIKRGLLSPEYAKMYTQLHPTYICDWLDRLKQV